MSDEPRDPTNADLPERDAPPTGAAETPPTDGTAAADDDPSAVYIPATRPAPATRPTQHREHSGQHGLLIAGRVAVALVAVIVLTVTGWEWSIKSRADSGIISRSVQAIVTDDSNLATATAAPPPAGSYQAENILLLGSDTRAGAANAAAGGTDASTSDGVANSDTQMIAHVSADRQHVTVLSVPRDTMIDPPTCKTWDAATGQLSDSTYPVSSGEKWHINSAYSVGGPQCSVRAIQDLTGLKIDRVIGIDFSGFQNMVDALGGVTINVCGPIIDGELGTVIPSGGTQTIQGNTALDLVRARNVQGDTDSDLARIRRQQIVLSAILQQVTSAGTLLNPAKLDAFLQAFVSNTFTDHVTIEDLVTLAQSFGTLDPSRVTFFTLPTVPSIYDSEALDPDETKAPAVFSALLNDQPLPGEPAATSAASATPVPTSPTATTQNPTGKTVDPSAIDLAIVNLTGRTGVATATMGQLNDIGFTVSEDNLLAPDGQQQSANTVEYDPTNVAQALTVAAAVPTATLVPVAGLGTQVRLLLGSSYDGTVQSVAVGAPVTGTLAEGTTGALPSGSAASTLSSGELTSVNAGAALCA